MTLYHNEFGRLHEDTSFNFIGMTPLNEINIVDQNWINVMHIAAAA